MRRARALVLAAALIAGSAATSAAPAQASCAVDCYQFTNSSSDVFSVAARECDTCSSYYVAPGHRSRVSAGGIAFHIPAGCIAKTSTWGAYWAREGWNWFPHRSGTVTMRPDGKLHSDC